MAVSERRRHALHEAFVETFGADVAETAPDAWCDRMDARFDRFDARFDRFDARFDEFDARFDDLGDDLRRFRFQAVGLVTGAMTTTVVVLRLL